MATVGFFKMPYLPEASVNHMHGLTILNGRPKKYLKAEAKNWKNQLRDKVTDWKREHGVTVQPGAAIFVNLTTHFPPRGGQGRGHKPDGFNFFKLANDAIAAGLGIDDHSFEGRLTLGIESDEPYLVYVVEVL